MRTTIFMTFGILIFAKVLSAQSSSECQFLLTDGIRNYIKTKSYERDYELVRNEICKTYNSYKMDGSVGNASAKFKAIFKGKASYSRTEIEAIGEASCNRSLDVNEYISNTSEYSEIIDPNWAKVVIQCLESNASGVRYKIEQSVDGYLGHISINVVYKGSSGDDAPTVVSIDADEEYFETSGSLKDAIGKRLTRSYILNVTRKNMDRIVPIYHAGKKVLLPSVVLTIGISNSENLSLVYPEIPYDEPIEITYGVGEVVSSLLDEITFLNAYNKNGQQWMLAEDKEVPIGTAYRKYLDDEFPNRNGKCPDLRGVFLRGKNYNRNRSEGNIKDLDVGSYQNDAIKSHIHTIKGRYFVSDGALSASHHSSNTKVTGGWDNDLSDKGKNHDIRAMANEHAEETRPKSVTVNFFIRIH